MTAEISTGTQSKVQFRADTTTGATNQSRTVITIGQNGVMDTHTAHTEGRTAMIEATGMLLSQHSLAYSSDTVLCA